MNLRILVTESGLDRGKVAYQEPHPIPQQPSLSVIDLGGSKQLKQILSRHLTKLRAVAGHVNRQQTQTIYQLLLAHRLDKLVREREIGLEFVEVIHEFPRLSDRQKGTAPRGPSDPRA